MRTRISKTRRAAVLGLSAAVKVAGGALPSVLQVAGLCVAAAGLYMLAPWLGVLAAGAFLFAVGIALDPDLPGKGDDE